jgi:hypothetical protein
MTKVEMESSANLINNLLLNLDSLKLQNETNSMQENASLDLQDQLEMLKFEAQKLTNQYTQNTNKNAKSKKIPPPIFTGTYNKKKTQFQTIDELLFELNNVTVKVYGSNQTPISKSSKSKKNSGSFVDPRRYSDPYKYTILSTLDETEDDEEESIYNPKTPKTALPFYGRKKNLTCNTNLKVPGSHYMSPNSAGSLRARSFSQPESCDYKSINCNENASLKCQQREQNDRISTKYLMKLHNSISNSNEKRSSSSGFVKPPRTSSINHSHKVSEGYASSESSLENEKIVEGKKRGTMGLENKSSFQSDVTLINEE